MIDCVKTVIITNVTNNVSNVTMPHLAPVRFLTEFVSRLSTTGSTASRMSTLDIRHLRPWDKKLSLIMSSFFGQLKSWSLSSPIRPQSTATPSAHHHSILQSWLFKRQAQQIKRLTILALAFETLHWAFIFRAGITKKYGAVYGLWVPGCSYLCSHRRPFPVNYSAGTEHRNTFPLSCRLSLERSHDRHSSAWSWAL